MRSKKPGRVAQRQAKLAKVRLTEALGVPAGVQEQDGPILAAGRPASTCPPPFLVMRARKRAYRELAKGKFVGDVKWLEHDDPSLPSRSTLIYSEHGRERISQRDPSEASLNEALGVPAGARVAFEAVKEDDGLIYVYVVTAKAYTIFSGNMLVTIIVDIVETSKSDKVVTDQQLAIAKWNAHCVAQRKTSKSVDKVFKDQQLAIAMWHARCVAERLDDDSDFEWSPTAQCSTRAGGGALAAVAEVSHSQEMSQSVEAQVDDYSTLLAKNASLQLELCKIKSLLKMLYSQKATDAAASMEAELELRKIAESA